MIFSHKETKSVDKSPAIMPTIRLPVAAGNATHERFPQDERTPRDFYLFNYRLSLEITRSAEREQNETITKCWLNSARVTLRLIHSDHTYLTCRD